MGGGGGGGVRRYACGFLFNFSKVTENAIITIKLWMSHHVAGSIIALSPTIN